MAEAAPVPEAAAVSEQPDTRILHTYPVVKHTDMVEEMRIDCVELSITACEKYATNYELAARTIKESMDKKFGIYWHVIVGENFGFEMSYETKNLMYLFFAGNLAVVVWKCS